MWSNKQLHCLRFMESLNITCQVIWNLRQRWELKMQMRCLMFGGLDVFAIFFGQSCIDTLCCASLLASLIIGLSWAGLRILLFRIVDTSMFVKSRTHGPSTGRRLLIQDSARQKGSALDQKALQSWLPKLLETTFVSLFIVTKIYFNFFSPERTDFCISKIIWNWYPSQDSAAGVAALWAMQPEEAEAFRQDRIFNAKQTLVPKIRNLEVIDGSIGLEGLFWCQKRIERWDGYWRKKTQSTEKKVETGGRKNVYYKRMIAKRSITCGSKKLVKVALRSPELMQSHWRAVLPFVQGKYYQKLEGPCPSISKDMTKMTLRCICLFEKSNIFRYQRRKGDGKTPMYAVCPFVILTKSPKLPRSERWPHPTGGDRGEIPETISL